MSASLKIMRRAVRSAREGVRQGHGGPFGACVVQAGRVVAAAHNTVLRDRDPTAHAEINAIREACRVLGTHDLSACELYATAEPCPMCLGAIYWARLSRLFIGAGREVAARHGFDDARFHREFEQPPALRSLQPVTGILREECENLFEEWKRRNGKAY